MLLSGMTGSLVLASRSLLRSPLLCCTPSMPQQTAAATAIVSSSSELLLLAKAIAVAVLAPDQMLPSPANPGVAGLLCSYVSIATSLCSSLVTGECCAVRVLGRGCGIATSLLRYALPWTCRHKAANSKPAFVAWCMCLLPPCAAAAEPGLLVRWLIAQRGLQPSAAGKADEEQPLLATSWEHPENNKQLHGKAGAAAGASGASAGSPQQPQQPAIQQATVLELAKLSLPDTPLLLVAFVFGTAAALMAACVPLLTGQIIDFASIDPDRCACGSVGRT
jgi:ATP-binding cassette subfamily B (MDR/TAP) protein 9